MGKIFQRMQLARSILDAVSQHRNVDTKSIVSRARYEEVALARREFCELAYGAGIGSILIGKILGRDHTTILYHVNPAWRVRKDQWRYRQNARRQG